MPPYDFVRFSEVARLIGADVDLILCEMVVSIDHARSILAVAPRRQKN
jgi:hypothetical protein